MLEFLSMVFPILLFILVFLIPSIVSRIRAKGPVDAAAAKRLARKHVLIVFAFAAAFPLLAGDLRAIPGLLLVALIAYGLSLVVLKKGKRPSGRNGRRDGMRR